MTELTVRVDPDGEGPEPAKQAEIFCDAAAGEGSAAAAGLRPADFEPTPADVACTEQFGGPQTATVNGTLDRKAIVRLRPQRRLRDRPLGQARRAAGAGGLMAYRVVLRHGPKVDKHDAETLAAALDVLEFEARAIAGGPRRSRSTCASAPTSRRSRSRRAPSCAGAACARASTSAATAPPRPGPAASAAR